MTVSLSLLVTAAVLCAVGGILVLTRSLTRILLGTVVLGNGVNLLILTSTGAAGAAPLLYPKVLRNRVTDPLPQAIALTAIVITLATTAFLLAMAYRSQQVSGTDEISDDTEDRLVALRAEVLDERSQLRARYREARAELGRTPEQRARYREERKQLRARLRADRAYQARARDASGDLWNDVLGADPEDYTDDDEPGPEAPAPRGDGPAPPGPADDPDENDREPGGPRPPDDSEGPGQEGAR
ncbi:Na(+)/H(+) antiporter subunit C [Streptomyces sp. NPDC049954]|uniref:Na(+)/H(+) antiporter subunit C n=1 Tax=Streptomyces sp. NPDC049954 TaxID=3155779 RepID=UPI00343382A4